MSDTKDMREKHLLRIIEVWKARAQKVELEGASLRDHFAGQALAAMIDSVGSAHAATLKQDARIAAKAAYTYADAMLSTRSKGDGSNG